MKRNQVIARLLGPVVGASVLALAAAFAPQAGAVALYDAQAIGSLTLSGVTNSSGGTVASGWALAVQQYEDTDFVDASGDADASTDAIFDCTATACTSMAIGESVSNTARATGRTGPLQGLALSVEYTNIDIVIDNTSGGELTFQFDWSAVVKVATSVTDPLADFAEGYAAVTLRAVVEGGTTDFQELVLSSDGGDGQRSPATQSCAPGGVAYDPDYLLCLTLGAGEQVKVEMWVDAYGLAESEPGKAPTPATLPLMGLGLVGAAALRRRRVHRRLG